MYEYKNITLREVDNVLGGMNSLEVKGELDSLTESMATCSINRPELIPVPPLSGEEGESKDQVPRCQKMY